MAELTTIDGTPLKDAAFQNSPPNSPPRGEDNPVSDEEHDDEEDDDLYSAEAEWDEGGPSHCGYGETLHNTLMSVGRSVHKLVGDPSPTIGKEMRAVGNWFQEASYATRDFMSGKHADVHNDAVEAINDLVSGGTMKDEKKEGEEDKKEEEKKAEN